MLQHRLMRGLHCAEVRRRCFFVLPQRFCQGRAGSEAARLHGLSDGIEGLPHGGDEYIGAHVVLNMPAVIRHAPLAERDAAGAAVQTAVHTVGVALTELCLFDGFRQRLLLTHVETFFFPN